MQYFHTTYMGSYFPLQNKRRNTVHSSLISSFLLQHVLVWLIQDYQAVFFKFNSLVSWIWVAARNHPTEHPLQTKMGNNLLDNFLPPCLKFSIILLELFHALRDMQATTSDQIYLFLSHNPPPLWDFISIPPFSPLETQNVSLFLRWFCCLPLWSLPSPIWVSVWLSFQVLMRLGYTMPSSLLLPI